MNQLMSRIDYIRKQIAEAQILAGPYSEPPEAIVDLLYLLERVERLEKELELFRALAAAADDLVAVCKRESIDLEYTIEGGPMGKPMQPIAKVSLLDHVRRALERIKKPDENNSHRAR